MTRLSGTPTARCPHCGREEYDFDGVGILAHTYPAYLNGCGWCSHPSRDDGVCGICASTDDEPGVQPGRAKPVEAFDDCEPDEDPWLDLGEAGA